MIDLGTSFRLFLALLAGWAICADAAVSVTRPFVGITVIARSEVAPRSIRMNVALVDLTAPGISFKLTPPSGARDTVRQTTLDFLDGEKAQLAVNVHFFVPYPSIEAEVDVVGLAVSQGRLYSPFEGQPVGPGQVDQSYAIIAHAPALNIDSSNRVGVVRRDPAFPDNRHTLPGVSLWNAFAGSAQIVSNGSKTVPSYSGIAGGLNPSKGFSDTNSWYSVPRARTAVGVTADRRTLVIFTVDQAAGSSGMTVGEVADLLIKDHKVADALNLDGGGSTTLVLQDPVTRRGRIVNASGDNPRGRAVGSSLAVFADSLPATYKSDQP